MTSSPNWPLQAGQDKPAMNFDVVNLSPEVTEREAKLICAAALYQLALHYCPRWGVMSSAINYVGSTQGAADAVPENHVLALILRDADQANALGYHEELAGKIIIKVFTHDTLTNGGTVLGEPTNPGAPSVSTTFTHEILETVGDKFTNYWAQGPRIKEGNLYAIENCDPVEADGYMIDLADPDDGNKAVSVAVTNFVLEAWFDPENLTGPFDHLGKLSAAFTMTPGGYMVVSSGAGQEQQVFANKETYPAWKLEQKKHPLSRTAKRLRKGKARAHHDHG